MQFSNNHNNLQQNKNKNKNDHIICDDTFRRNEVFIFVLREYDGQLKRVCMLIAILIELFVTRFVINELWFNYCAKNHATQYKMQTIHTSYNISQRSQYT